MSLPLSEGSDGELAAQALAGRQDAYRELLARHRDAVFRLVRASVGDPHEALELRRLATLFLDAKEFAGAQGFEVTDEVADSESSLCWDEAGNRLTAMRGLLVYFTRYQKDTTELQKAAAKEELDAFMASRGLN